MYAGRVVEKGSVDDIFYNPLHPYTRGLLNSIPTLGGTSTKNTALYSWNGAASVGHFLLGVRFNRDVTNGCRHVNRCLNLM